MDILRDKAGLSKTRLIILVFVVLSGIAAALLYFPPILTHTEAQKTSGEITFIDSAGNPLTGAISLSGDGVSSGPPRPNVNLISWHGIPGTIISYDDFANKGLSINLRISGDSPKGRVVLENYGINQPGSVNVSAPGTPVKYVEFNSSGVSFSNVDISIKYTDAEVKGLDVNNLTIYKYDGAMQVWNELPTKIDTTNKIATTTVNSLSLFALSTKIPAKIEVRDTRNAAVVSDIKTYDETNKVKKAERTSTLSVADIPLRGELEVDASKTKNVAVKLKLKTQGGGKIILDDYGKKNPVAVAPPGTTIKYVDISTVNISIDSAEVRIYYTNEELNGVDARALIVYHWNGTSWEALPTTVDPVNNVLTATTSSLSPFAASAGTGGTTRILVATNRYVILDDPNDVGAQVVTGSGFQVPTPNDWGSRSTVWTGIATTINATAMYIDNNGFPVSGKVIKFTLYWPNGTALTTVNDTTNSRGLANFSYNLDNKNYYGRWNVKAENSTIGSNTSFIYNWWGCSWGTTGTCGNQHSGVTPPAGGTANSPYLSGRNYDTGITQHTSHGADWTNSDANACTNCHQSFDNNTGDAYTARYDNHPADVHRNITCDNANCHGSYTTHNSGQLVYSCYNSGCHGNASAWDRKDLSNKSTLNSGTVSTAVSIYSYNNASTFNATFHTPNSTVPCIICHGPMHNITKPDETQRFTRNQATESEHCTTCHSNYNKHNNSVNCTLCHSDDVHDIQVFAQNATYVDLNHDNPNPARGNCTNCHQNATFFAALKVQPKAGNYTGRDPPQIPVPLNHSTDPYAGSLWNGSQPAYWDNTSQKSACYYCHGISILHSISALGNVSNITGYNKLNQDLGISRWCANCHYMNASEYAGNLLTPQPPEILNQSGLVPAKSSDGTNFTNHSDYISSGYNDSVCKNCHNNNLTASATSLNFSHNVNIGSAGGPDCISCHDINGNGAPGNKRINATAMKSGVHGNLNRNATNSTSIDQIDKACWACHGDGLEPAGHPVNKTNPWSCPDCHNATTAFTSSNATIKNDITVKKIYNHIPVNYTTDSFKISSDFWNRGVVNCTACHNKSTVYFNVTFTAANPLAANVSHYANTSNLITPSINCILCHKSPANATEWYANLTRHPAKTQELSFCANCHNNTNATTLHSQPLRLPMVIHGGWETGGGFDWENNSATLDGAACYACHGIGNPNDIQANLQSVKLCENCHVNVSSIFTGPNRTTWYTLRTDINDTLPYVYSHTNYSNVTGTNLSVPSQGGTATYPTTCYAYNAVTGEATCHAAPYFNRSNFGGYYAQYDDPYGPYAKYDPPHWTVPIDRMPNTTDCLFCHNQSIGTIRIGWGNALQVNASNMFGNRYSISKDSCYACHTRNQSMPVDFHSNEVVPGGGPGCLDCHNKSNPQNFTGLHYIDGANFNISVHANMNSNNASGYGINASCWACHNSSGYVVANNTHPDKRDTPYTCPDCHLANGSNAGAYNATIISNHYRNGTNIRALDNRTSDLASCLGCHENVSGMITPNNDTDYGSFASDGVGVSGGNMSFYHYGANRSNFGITAGSYDYCIYCHNATGEFSSVFQDNANRSISNHSLRYNSSNPSCSVSVCHNSTNSSLHGAQLIKPNINITLYNSSYCLDCHGLNVSNGATNYTGAVTTYKEMHNNSVNCTECHTGPDKKNIHPMTYLQPNGTYDTGNQTAVNCTDCHQQNTLDSQLSRTPPKVSTVQHGNTSLNSSFWNGTQQGYWTNTSQESMCDYCHGDSRHNATGLGRPSNWSGSNIMNSSITSNGNWCAGCHYEGYSNSEKFNINMTQAFTGVNLSVPPEITNSSIYSPYNLSGYYNHSLTPDYNDTTCKGCHGKSLSTATISEFMHNINTGLCTSCHFNYDYMNGSVNKPDKYVNSTMFSASPHGSLACEDCHTKGHNDIGARKACEDCHAYQSDPKNETERHNITSSPSTYNYNGINVVNITDCTVCHDSTLYNSATANYGYNKTIDCNYCHTYPDKTYS